MILMMTIDVILGINLLVKHHALIECSNKRVRFGLPGEKSFYLTCDKNVISSLVSAIKISTWLGSGDIVFLTKIKMLNNVQ